MPNSGVGWWAVAGIMVLASLAITYRDRARIGYFIRTRWRILWASEFVFLGFFAVIAVLRGFMPAIEATEKPMELMLLNSVVQTPYAPPQDAWLSGNPVSYYYFGYWMLGGLSTMAGVATEWAFNLSLALVGGSAAAGIFGLAMALVRMDGGSQRSAVLVGVSACFLLLFVATLAGWWELAAHLGVGSTGFYGWLHIDGLTTGQSSANWRPDQHWWWFRASRVINSYSELGVGQDFTIQEFPAFSFILGDLHPHVISIPFVLAGIGVAANIYFSRDRWGLNWIRLNHWPAAIGVLVIGAAGFINAWDMLLVCFLLVGVAIFKVMKDQGGNLRDSFFQATPALLVLAGIAVLIYSPYYFGTLESQVQSPPLGPSRHGTRVVHFLTIWGGPLLLSALWVAVIVGSALRPQFVQVGTRGPHAARVGTVVPWGAWKIGGAMIGIPYLTWYLTHMTFTEGAVASDILTRLGTAGPLGILFLCLFVTLAWRSVRGAADSTQFVLILASLALYLLFSVELFFVHDLFGNRMNTVFKLYYQVWILVSLGISFAAYSWWRIHSRLTGISLVASRTLAVLAVVLAIGPIYYPMAAAVTRANEYGGGFTMDGLAWLAKREPDEYAAIQWLRNNVPQQIVLAEAVGGSYTEFGRISQTTGLPAVLGWTGHENQWRSDPTVFAGRELDVRELYETSDIDAVERIVSTYGIELVVVGNRERRAYPALDVSKFDTLGDRVFEQGAVVIYRVR